MTTIDIAERDVDVPLSALGKRQADALGHWFAKLDAQQKPGVVLHSPYVRAWETATRILEVGGFDGVRRFQDERLREKEFGILDRLTVAGINSRFPQLAEQRKHVGKFYFRPPGGESWCDVILRLRSFLETLTREYRHERVLVVAHQVTVNCLRYLLERMDETEILAIDREQEVPNCGVTSYYFDARRGHHGKMVLDLHNFVSPLQESGTSVTAAPDLPTAPKA